MKIVKNNILLISILSAIIGFIFSSCEEHTYASRPRPYVVVLKFEQPDYKNYILANYFDGDDKILGMRYNRCREAIGAAGDSPYWELPQNWLLVDWKWNGFPYNSGLCLLTELTWDKFEIDTTNISGIPSWPLTEPHLLHPVENILYVQVEYLASYLGIKYSYDVLNVVDGIYSDSLCKQCELGDSIWAILQNDLSSAIESGDLEHINDYKSK